MNVNDIKQKIGFILTAVLVIVPVFILPLGGYEDHFYFPKYMLLLAGIVIILLLALRYVEFLVKSLRFDLIDYMLFIYTGMVLVSAFFSHNFASALYGGLNRHMGLVTHLALTLLFLVARIHGNLTTKSWLVITLTALLLGFYGILQYYGFDPIMRDFLRQGWKSAFSTFGNPNFAGTFYVMVLPLTLSLIGKFGKWMYLLYGGILLALLYTLSLAAWIGAFASVIISLGLYWFVEPDSNQRNRFIKYTIIISAGVVIVFNGLTSNLLFKELGQTASETVEVIEHGPVNQKAGSGRIFIWSRTIILISQRPLLGYGIENMVYAFVDQFNEDMLKEFGNVLTVDKAHNEYLQIAVDSGLPALFLYLGFVFLSLKQGLKRVREDKTLIYVLAAVLGYLIQAIFSFAVISNVFLFWILLGILVPKNLTTHVDECNP